jgi:hypothetical protein
MHCPNNDLQLPYMSFAPAVASHPRHGGDGLEHETRYRVLGVIPNLQYPQELENLEYTYRRSVEWTI